LVALEHHPDGLSFSTRGGALAAKGRRLLGNGRVLRGEAAAQGRRLLARGLSVGVPKYRLRGEREVRKRREEGRSIHQSKRNNIVLLYHPQVHRDDGKEKTHGLQRETSVSVHRQHHGGATLTHLTIAPLSVLPFGTPYTLGHPAGGLDSRNRSPRRAQ